MYCRQHHHFGWVRIFKKREKKIFSNLKNLKKQNRAGRKEDIKERGEMLHELMAKSTSSYDKEKLQERVARLTGGVAVVKVGGASEVEVGERKDRITDALNATRAAVQEGIVPGGGVALLYASRSLESLKESTKKVNFDQGQGIQIVQDALKCKIVRKSLFININPIICFFFSFNL